jgi:ABC-2 type transport system permease protein
VTFLDKQGIDARQLRTLLGVYLKLDLRSGKAMLRQGKKENLTSNRALLSILLMYMVSGLVIGLFVFVHADVFFFSLIASSYTFALIALAVITESGNVIFNENEPDIIGHLPITSRTLFAAKTLNLFLFALLLAAAVNFFPTIFGMWATGSSVLFGLAHIISAFFVSVFATVLVVTSYGLLMRYVDKEKFNNIIAYAQTALTIIFIFSYQLLPRLMEQFEFNSAETFGKYFYYFLFYPPAWFSGLTLLLMGQVNRFSLALAAIGLLMLGIVGFVALRKIAGGYSSFVSRLAFDSSEVVVPKAGILKSSRDLTQAKRSGGLAGIKALWLRNGVECAVFDLVSSYIKRDREIKVRLYPTFAYFVVFPVLGLLSNELSDPFFNSRFVFGALVGGAMISFVMMSATEVLLFSEHYAAAYVFRVAPVESLSYIHRGVRKATFVYFAIPGALILFLFYSVIWRNPWHAFLIIAPWLIITPSFAMFSFLRREIIPLSRKYQKGQQSARSMAIFFVNSFCLLFVGILQNFAISGRIAYWVFILVISLISWAMYYLLRWMSGESRPLTPVISPFDNE